MQILKTHNKIYLQLFSLIIIFLISGSLLVNIFLGVTAIYFFYLMKNNSIKFNKDYFWPLIIIYAYLIFNSILSIDPIISGQRNIFFLRFFCLILILAFFFEKFDQFFLKISIFWIVILIILSLDIIYQGYFGYNILGYKTSSPTRNSSFFFSELKAASIINGLGFLSLTIIYHFRQKKFIALSILLIFLAATFVTGERSNFLKFLIMASVFLFLLMGRKNLKITFFTLFTFLTISFLTLIFTSNNIMKRFQTSTSYKDKNDNIIQIYKYSQWGAHAYTAFEIFKDNRLFGVGNKNFRIACTEYQKIIVDKYNIQPRGCSTHPHQLYYELISEHGLIGTVIILSSLFYLIFKRLNKPMNKINYISLTYILVTFIPLLPSGSFFTTYNATLFSLNFGFFLYNSHNKST